MKKNNKKSNILIRKNLKAEIEKKGIKRASSESLDSLERHLKRYLDDLAPILKEEMTIKGRKTLKREDVETAFSIIKTKEPEWEI
jgi:histone H3/H4